ncbi:MAG TPA: hypothetical protein VI299_04400 [Polyangiales bacterium]
MFSRGANQRMLGGEMISAPSARPMRAQRWWPPALIMTLFAVSYALTADYLDERHRLELKQIAFISCLTHHQTKDIRTCEKIRPEKLAPQTYQMCLMRFTGKECAPYMAKD